MCVLCRIDIVSMVNPIAFSLGPLAIHWYSVMWIIAFGCVYGLLLWRVHHREGPLSLRKEQLADLLFYSLVGALVGGRMGYVLFYNLGYYGLHPLSIISPYDFSSGVWTGIYGMSYHGGVLGVLIALWYSAKKYNLSFLRLTDYIVPAVPLGYFFGRLGNFFNHELVGRATEHFVGVDFGDGVLRHPSQIYEAVGEGIILFLFLWFLRNKKMPPGVLSSLYIMGYALVRFILEFFRAPDAHLGFVLGIFTMGQVLSGVMFLCGVVLFVVQSKRG